MKLSFKTEYDEELKQFVGICDQFPFLASSDKDELKALKGIVRLTEKELSNIASNDIWKDVFK